MKFKISTENGGSISTMLPDGETEVTTNALLSQCGIVHFNVTTPSQSDLLGSFINTHILSLQLVHHFDCPSLSKALEHKSKVLMIRAKSMGHYHSLWKLLPLIETYRFAHVRELIDLLAIDPVPGRPEIQTVLKYFNDGQCRVETLSQMFSRVLVLRKPM